MRARCNSRNGEPREPAKSFHRQPCLCCAHGPLPQTTSAHCLRPSAHWLSTPGSLRQTLLTKNAQCPIPTLPSIHPSHPLSNLLPPSSTPPHHDSTAAQDLNRAPIPSVLFGVAIYILSLPNFSRSLAFAALIPRTFPAQHSPLPPKSLQPSSDSWRHPPYQPSDPQLPTLPCPQPSIIIRPAGISTPSILYSVPSVHWLIGLVPSDVWYLKRSSQQPRFAWKPLQKPPQPPSIDSIIKAIIILFRE